MAPEKKVTVMVIKVNLACEKCRKKIKRILCDIPQIESQSYDEKANTVKITVVCCSPEKIKCKICSKGGKTVKGIEIEKPKPPKIADEEQSKEPENEKPKDRVPFWPPACCWECSEGRGGGPCYGGYEPYGTPAFLCYMFYGRPVYDNWGYYLCEENPRGCIIM